MQEGGSDCCRPLRFRGRAAFGWLVRSLLARAAILLASRTARGTGATQRDPKRARAGLVVAARRVSARMSGTSGRRRHLRATHTNVQPRRVVCRARGGSRRWTGALAHCHNQGVLHPKTHGYAAVDRHGSGCGGCQRMAKSPGTAGPHEPFPGSNRGTVGIANALTGNTLEIDIPSRPEGKRWRANGAGVIDPRVRSHAMVGFGIRRAHPYNHKSR